MTHKLREVEYRPGTHRRYLVPRAFVLSQSTTSQIYIGYTQA